MTGLHERLALAVGFVSSAVQRPTELVDRARGRRENSRQEARGDWVDPAELANRDDPVDAAHELVGETDCQACEKELVEAREALRGSPEDSHTLDGGTGLAQILWVLVRHTRPERIVETGVFRGVSSAWILHALDRNDKGRLWSIDLPPERYRGHIRVGCAVPERLWGRWKYIRGSSRRRLLGLLEHLGSIDLFVHDGLHTLETMSFEFEHVWPRLQQGGVLVADDVNTNAAFVQLVAQSRRDPLLVIESDKDSVVGLLRR